MDTANQSEQVKDARAKSCAATAGASRKPAEDAERLRDVVRQLGLSE
jgi:hypothetical protein